MNIVTAQPKDLPEVAEVHSECFPDSFSTQIGKKLLAKYYGEYMKANPGLFLVCRDETRENRIVGFCMGYTLPGCRCSRLFIRRCALRLAARCIYLFLTGNRLFFQKLKSLIAGPERCEIRDKAAEETEERYKGHLLSICVLDFLRGGVCTAFDLGI